MQFRFSPDFHQSPSPTNEYVIAKSTLKLYKLSDQQATAKKNIIFSLYANGGSLANSQKGNYNCLNVQRLHIAESIPAFALPLPELIAEELIESREVKRDMEGWLHFDVRHAVDNWENDPKLNNGLRVEVTDSSGGQLPAFQWLHPMNCSGKRL
jgi:hypothetical protein